MSIFAQLEKNKGTISSQLGKDLAKKGNSETDTKN